MLSARIADSMSHTKHNQRKEMLGLGLANLASGIMGGIPATAALARTSLNIKAHATSKASAILNAIFVALISFFLLRFFSYIPLAVIAAILVNVAIQMIEAEHFIKFFKYERVNFWISLGVALITIYKDPIIGILIGSTLSLLVLIDKIAKGQAEIKIDKYHKKTFPLNTPDELDKNNEVAVYSLKGKLCYINSRAHIKKIETDLSKYSIIILDLQGVFFIDLDGVAALEEIIELTDAKKQKLFLAQCPSHIAHILKLTSPGYRRLKQNRLVYDDIQSLLQHINL
jgi:sulfate permease, SulP family